MGADAHLHESHRKAHDVEARPAERRDEYIVRLVDLVGDLDEHLIVHVFRDDLHAADALLMEFFSCAIGKMCRCLHRFVRFCAHNYLESSLAGQKILGSSCCMRALLLPILSCK